MNRDQKIDKINAYKKLIETKRLPKIEQDSADSVETEIVQEFQEWAENQLANLLGDVSYAASGQFNEEQAEVLRIWADKMLAKTSATNTTPQPRQEPPRSTTPQQQVRQQNTYRPPSSAQPLGNRKNEQKQTDPYLNHLAELERKYPGEDY